MENNKKTVVLVTPPSHTHRTAEENLGIGYLASSLRAKGFPVVIIDAWLYNYPINILVEKILTIKNILFVGISCYRSSLDDVGNVIKQLRPLGYNGVVTVGGFGPTFHDSDFLSVGVDVVLKGEAEDSIVELANLLNNRNYQKNNLSKISGASWLGQAGQINRTNPIKADHLDSLFFPARDTMAMNLQMKNPAHLVTSRGCTSNCLFCSIISFERLTKNRVTWRQRSIGNIIEEIKYLFNEYGISTFKIVDDSFIEEGRDVVWTETFLNELRKNNLKIRFRTQVKANVLTSELVVCLKEAGWFSTSVGIENFAETALRRMNKSSSLEQNLNALAMLEENGIYVVMNLILFDHSTTWSELKENLFYLNKFSWPVIKGLFTEMYAAEGTAYSRLLKKRGELLPNSNFMNRQYNLVNHDVGVIYTCLKKWHKSHSAVYDHAINVIAAPKNLPDYGYQKYFRVYRPLYDLDLQFFAKLISLLEQSAHKQLPQALEFTNNFITNTKQIFATVEGEVTDLDLDFGISYQAESNPFLHIPGDRNGKSHRKNTS
ncbi:MAG: radical SAM protein [Patescibacteria group bacterium]